MFVFWPEDPTASADLNKSFETAGWPNLACSFDVPSRFRAQYPKHAASLSIKFTFKGQEIYELDGRPPVLVDPTSYLILNEGCEYACVIDTPTDLESFCIFFRTGLADEVLAAIALRADALLSDPTIRISRPPQFMERLYPKGDSLTSRLSEFHKLIVENGNSDDGLEEWYHSLVESMLFLQGMVQKSADSLPHMRYSTRIETYRRLHRARDFIASCSDRRLLLKDMAMVAGLSPHHFLRLFKQAFQETPHQYLIRRRLERAQELLRHGCLDVSQVCLEVGFESISSFSTLFRRRLGMSPAQFKQLKNRR